MVVCNWKNISGIQTCMNFSIVIMVNIFSISHIFQQICVFSTKISKYKIGKFSTKISTRKFRAKIPLKLQLNCVKIWLKFYSNFDYNWSKIFDKNWTKMKFIKSQNFEKNGHHFL